MKTIKDIQLLKGVKVLVRADFNVPVKNDVVVDDYRIQATLPTINFLREKGAKVILISHLEASDGSNGSLSPVAKQLKKLGQEVVFIENWKNANNIIENEMKDGGCVLLENLRYFDGEKANDTKFSKELASLADIYVNDAFSVSHRAHASVVGVTKYLSSYAGLQLEKEIGNLSKVFNPAHPFLFILGGAKFETKLPLLEKFMDIADFVFVGGALATDIFKEKGYEIGKSLVSKGDFDLLRFANNPKLLLPLDLSNQNREIKPVNGLNKEDQSMDSGPETLELLKQKVSGAKFILWNGPLGVYEKGFKDNTLKLAKMIAEATSNGTETIVGGGDTLAAIAENGDQGKFTFVSTGGGAMLEFLAKGTLPGIEVLNNS
ncbi:MAG: phosphoglycerate kinase [Candidatus Paceibacterota bacterium]